MSESRNVLNLLAMCHNNVAGDYQSIMDLRNARVSKRAIESMPP